MLLRPALLRIAPLLALALAGCGSKASGPAPPVKLNKDDAAVWAPGKPRREMPVLRFNHLQPATFARQLALLHYSGYRTITLDRFVRFLDDEDGEPPTMPARPILLTFDDGTRADWRAADPLLRRYGYSAVMFVDAGRVDNGDPAYLRWRELAKLQAGGRWDIQLESGFGKHLIRWGPKPNQVGSFYTFLGADEIVNGWRERVFGDLAWGERMLAFHVPGYRPAAIAPPYGNYGQLATNHPDLQDLLLAHLYHSFPLVFVQDHPAPYARGNRTETPIRRYPIRTIDDLTAAISASLPPPESP